ncbi:MAG: hypothetical protein LBP56_02160 [Odoribacteraceae bacterium]|jgi:tetratricopeptide (TPR) repeat protein|nr:hypothetical protein [Odoribacteraceae bacterium]
MKRVFLIIACIAYAWPLQAQEEEGFRLLRAKRYEAALAAFARLVETTDSPPALVVFNAAVCATRVGDHAAAERYFSLSIANGYNLFSAYVGKANALKARGKDDEMLATLREAMKAGTGADSLQREKVERMYAACCLERGRARLRANEIAKAAESYMLLTRMEGKRWKVDGYLALGTLYTVSGHAILSGATGNPGKRSTVEAARKRAAVEFKKARDYLNRAARLSPDDLRVQDALARLQDKA